MSEPRSFGEEGTARSWTPSCFQKELYPNY